MDLLRILFCVSIFMLALMSDCALFAQSKSESVKSGATGEFEILRDFFEYDKSVPLNGRVVKREDYAEFVREKIVFRGTRDSRVPGFLAIPKNRKGPVKCVLLLHGIGGSKSDFWQDSFHSGEKLTHKLLSEGFAVLTVDAIYHGERAVNNDFESPEVFLFQKGWMYRARDMVVDSVIEHRRAIDYLESREEIDASEVSLVGYSMGGMMVFQLAAIDSRVKTSVACVTPVLDEPNSAMAVANFAPQIPELPFLMLIGKEDVRNYSVESAEALFNKIPGTNKKLVAFDSGHKLPPEWIDTVIKWLNQQ